MRDEPLRGPAVLRELLASGPHQVATLPEEAFSAWIRAQLASAEHDPVFQQRLAIRALLRSHKIELAHATAAVEAAAAAYQACGCAPQLDDDAQTLRGLSLAVRGLEDAVAAGRGDAAKLEAYRARAAELQRHYDRATSGCTERGVLDRARAALRDLEQRIGLDEARRTLEQLNRRTGRQRSRRGEHYEDAAAKLIEHVVVPELAAHLGRPVRSVRGATLGCARGEFDHLLYVSRRDGEPVRVVGVVEVKRNLDDLGHGFQLRQENLAWLRGDQTGYSPSDYRTNHFPTGHFDRPATEGTVRGPVSFDPSSFAELHPLAGLWFVTEHRSLSGLSGRELQMVRHRLATDLDIDPALPESHRELQRWVTGRAAPLQAAHVLKRYLDAGLADRILLTRRQTPDAHRR